MKNLPNKDHGFIHLVPVLLIAVLLVAGISVVNQRSSKQTQVNSPNSVLGDDDRDDRTPSPSPFRIDEETRDENGGISRVQVQENQTRLEQEFFEGGVRKRVEMRNENGRIKVRIKTEDAVGNETEERLELRPDEGIVRLKVVENGVEQSIKVRAQADRFVIEQEGLSFGAEGASATTRFPLTVDPETNSIAVTTPFGVVNVQQLPAKAIEQVLAANVIDTVESTELAESEQQTQDPNKQVVFKIKGVKNTRFLGLIKVDAPILAEVSAITGQTTFVDQPWYLDAFGFLFAK